MSRGRAALLSPRGIYILTKQTTDISPHGSRASSPNPQSTSRATSPSAPAPTASTQAPPPPPLPEKEDILRYIPAQGIPAGELSKRFQHMLPRDDALRKQWVARFLARVRELTDFDNATKFVKRKDNLA